MDTLLACLLFSFGRCRAHGVFPGFKVAGRVLFFFLKVHTNGEQATRVNHVTGGGYDLRHVESLSLMAAN